MKKVHIWIKHRILAFAKIDKLVLIRDIFVLIQRATILDVTAKLTYSLIDQLVNVFRVTQNRYRLPKWSDFFQRIVLELQ